MNKKILFRYVILLALIGLTSCSTPKGAVFKKVELTDKSKALLYFYRENKFVGSGRDLNLIIDQKGIVSLRNGQFTRIYLEPGEHIISIKVKNTKGRDRSLNLEKGDILYYKGDLAFGVFSLTRITESQSLADLKELKYQNNAIDVCGNIENIKNYNEQRAAFGEGFIREMTFNAATPDYKKRYCNK